MPLFSLPSQKGKKTDRGLYRGQKQKCLTDAGGIVTLMAFIQSRRAKRERGQRRNYLSLSPLHFPHFSLCLYREPGTSHHAWKQLTIFSCLQVFSPKLGVFWLWLAGFFVFELRLFWLFRFRAEDAWFFSFSRLLLCPLFRSL